LTALLLRLFSWPMRMPCGLKPLAPKGRGAAGAYPLAAAFVAFLLLFKTLLQRFHELVPAHLLDLRFFLGAEFKLEVFAQPFQRDVFGEIGQHLHALEVGGKGAVELVVVLLVFHQHRAAEVIEVVDLVRAFTVIVQRRSSARQRRPAALRAASGIP
jgi:hypothetical protein